MLQATVTLWAHAHCLLLQQWYACVASTLKLDACAMLGPTAWPKLAQVLLQQHKLRQQLCQSLQKARVRS